MTNTLQRLQDKRLITVEPHPASGRQKLVRMTRLDRRRRDDAIARAFPDDEAFLTRFDAGQARAVLPLLRQVREYLDAQRQEQTSAARTRRR